MGTMAGVQSMKLAEGLEHKWFCSLQVDRVAIQDILKYLYLVNR